ERTTRRGYTRDVGEAPGYAAEAPAAMLATMVPWPSRSLAPGVPVRSMVGRTEPNASALAGSTPESTTAIAGASGAGDPCEPQSGETPVASGQIRPDVTLGPLMRPFGVIERTAGSEASDSSCEPGMFATRPRMTENSLMFLAPASFARSRRIDVDAVGCP